MKYKTTTSYRTLTILITCFILLLANSAFCSSLTIDSCFWTTTTDCDDDGYASYRWLVVDILGTSSSGSAYIEVWTYYGEDEHLIAKTNDFTTPGIKIRRSFWVNGNGHYTGPVWVKVLDAGSDAIEVEYHFTEYASFEAPEYDIEVTLPYLAWSGFDYQDNDGDGYYAWHRLDFNFNSCPIPETIYFKISACKKPILAGPCFYYTSPDYLLDASGEFLDVIVGGVNGELSHGEYQIDIVAFSAANDEQLTGFFTVSGDMKFETEADDALPAVDFSIGGVFLDDIQTDKDKDLYSRARDLHFDPNVSTGSYDLTAKILYKPCSGSVYELYHVTPAFNITGEEADYQTVTLGVPNDQLDSNTYDFKIELYLGTSLVAWKDAEDDSDLNDQWFETPIQDASLIIANASWSETYDYDEDGSPSVGDLTVDLQAIEDSDDIYLELWGYCGENFYIVTTSDTFELSDPGMEYTFRVHHEHAFCGGSIQLKRESTGEVEDYLYVDAPPYFEAMVGDMHFRVESYTLADTVDNDEDGYFSHLTLMVDVDVAPLSDSAYLMLSLCKYPILAGPCWYYTSPVFAVDSAGRSDACVVDIGLPNDELVYGEYQVAFTVNDPETDEMLVGFQYMPASMFFEPSGEDLLPSLLDAHGRDLKEVRMYPNPARSTLMIQFENTYYKDIQIRIINQVGIVFVDQNYTPEDYPGDQLNMDISALPPGLYSLQIRSRSWQYSEKLIITE